jgi:hypothetical protein
MGKDSKKTTSVQELEVSSEVMEIIEKAIRDTYHFCGAVQ